ncbi:hypothetical protein [Echinicola salinicaeni]|uniref:hypothetical protein n=1 Tax=Echinicola salinicaeni TaxID=2762757 RepID=UPI001645ABB0|nr:hypothetical protein [Echinicola salinicaeni]
MKEANQINQLIKQVESYVHNCPDEVMAIELYEGSFQNISGMVEYPKTFFE